MIMTTLPTPSLGPNLTVSLNALSTILLITGYIAIRCKRITFHKWAMTSALVSSTAFLAVYVGHHYLHGSTRYPLRDWTYVIYLLVLIPHIILATLMVPFIIRGVWLAWTDRFDLHARLMRKVWPVWIYVSVTGVVVYVMLYILPGQRDLLLQ